MRIARRGRISYPGHSPVVAARSKVGKSSAAERLAHAGEIVHIDLDRRLQELDRARPLIDVAQDWAVVGPLLEELDARLVTDRWSCRWVLAPGHRL